MPRQLKLHEKRVDKSVYWFTKAGGDTYLGNVDVVPYHEAKELFTRHLQSLEGGKECRKGRGKLTGGALMDTFLGWIERHRSKPGTSVSPTGEGRFLRGAAMLQITLAAVVQYAARTEAFCWYCEQHGIPDP